MGKQIITAAGGLVFNQNDELLMIYRRGKWDLPKGKLEVGEDLPTCAIREIKEETGIINVTLKHFIGKTEHHYFDTFLVADVIKECHWYLMASHTNNQLVPQTDEDIIDIKWVAKTDLSIYLNDSYDTIVKIVTKYLMMINDDSKLCVV